jgi:putative transposase
VARRTRLIIAGQPHHVVQRGHNRGIVFFADDDYLYYKECLKNAAEKYGCTIHAYCLMTNHVHLLVTPVTKEGLSRMMQMLGRLYVRHINKRKKRSGTLWESRFKVSLVDAEGYLLSCMRYIEMNPVRARMVRKPENYPWSSIRANRLGETDALISAHPVYESLGATPASRCSSYSSLFDLVISQDDLDLIRRTIHGNWVLGNDRFSEKIAKKTGLNAAPHPHGGDRRSEQFKTEKKKSKA